MGGIDFDWKGKSYDPFFQNDEEEKAFEGWRATTEGMAVFGPIPRDWSKEHYLDDHYPWDSARECRVEAEKHDDDKDDDEHHEAAIDWCDYDKCRYGCYRHFYQTSETHVVSDGIGGVWNRLTCKRRCVDEFTRSVDLHI